MQKFLTVPSTHLRFLAAALGLMAALGFASQLHAQEATIRELERLEDLWGKAEVAKDSATLGQLLAEDFMSIGADGAISDRAHYLADIKANTQDYVSAADSDRKVRIYGDTAVDTGLWTETVKSAKGPQTNRYRWTSVWIRQPDHHWLCVTLQAVRLPAPTPDTKE